MVGHSRSDTLQIFISLRPFCAADAGGEIQALCQLLEAVELEGVLVQADALHANRPLSSTSPSAAATS
jgi:predicted transposase YbfD/YdcC